MRSRSNCNGFLKFNLHTDNYNISEEEYDHDQEQFQTISPRFPYNYAHAHE